MKPTDETCPCQSGSAYVRCCGPFHGGVPAPDAEALMRSRYTAYVQRRRDYLLDTWHATTRPTDLSLDAVDATTWLGLAIRRHDAQADGSAIVEFVARYRRGGGAAVRLHEISRFVRADGRWFYVDGTFPGTDKRRR